LSSKLTVHERRALVEARYNLGKGSLRTPPRTWRQWLSVETLLTNLVRLGFLAAVIAVILGAWMVAEAHLTEQFLGAPQETSGLIDPTAGQNALTPEYIEAQVLAFSVPLPLSLVNRRVLSPNASPPKVLSSMPISLISICG
jgi:hypothetical protein